MTRAQGTLLTSLEQRCGQLSRDMQQHVAARLRPDMAAGKARRLLYAHVLPDEIPPREGFILLEPLVLAGVRFRRRCGTSTLCTSVSARMKPLLGCNSSGNVLTYYTRTCTHVL